MMRVLCACEESQEVTKRMRALGIEAYSCDLLPCSGGHPEWHLRQDVREVLVHPWDMVLAFPPCTYLTVTGNRWFDVDRYGDKARERHRLRDEAAEFFGLFTALGHVPMVAIENPVGVMSTRYRKPDQIVHPWWFGDAERKATCLWLKGLPPLTATNPVEPRVVAYKNGRGTDSPWHMDTMKLPPAERARARSKTFPGVADAMATQWGAWALRQRENGGHEHGRLFERRALPSLVRVQHVRRSGRGDRAFRPPHAVLLRALREAVLEARRQIRAAQGVGSGARRARPARSVREQEGRRVLTEEFEQLKADEARAYLRHVRDLGMRVRGLQASIDDARSRLLPAGIAYDKGGGGGGCYADAIPDGVAKVQELVADYATELAGLVDEQRAARECIAKVRDMRRRETLEGFYLRGESFEMIAVKLDYSYESVRLFHRLGLAEVWAYMPAEWRSPMEPAL